MKKMICSTFVLFVLAVMVHGQSAKPHPLAQERLARLAGRWTIEERYAGDAKKYVKTSACSVFSGGPHLVCESESETPLGPSKGLAILSYNAPKGTFTQYTIAGVDVAVLVSGTVTNNAWIGTTEFPFNGDVVTARVTVVEESPAAWTYKMEGSINGSRPFVLQEARGVKVAD